MSRMAILAAALPLLLHPVPVSSLAPQRTPSPGDTSGLILGRVVEAGTDRGVRGAIVTLGSSALVGRVPGGPSGSVGGSAVSTIRVSTAPDGSFVFRGLGRGDYTITAAKPGYVMGAYGRYRPDGPSAQLALNEGEKVADAMVPMWKVSSISGTVVDERGEPVVGIELQALLRTTVNGRRRFARTGLPAITDDRGMYRFSSLAPGDYLVAVVSAQVSVPVSMLEAYRDGLGLPSSERMKLLTPIFDIGGTTSLPGNARSLQHGSVVRSFGGGTPPPPDARGRLFVYPTTFYPSSAVAAQASVITTTSGEERNGIDIQLRPVATSPVSGTVTGPDDVIGGVALRLLPEGGDSGIELDSVAATLTDSNGAFTFPAVPLGAYIVKASKRPSSLSMGTTTMMQVGNITYTTSVTTSEAPSGPPPPTFWAAAPLSVGRNPVSELAIALRPGIRVSGTVQFEGTEQKPNAQALARIVIGLDPVEGSSVRLMLPPESRVSQSGAFEVPGVEAGRYVVRITGVPPGWSIQGATSGGRNVADVPLELEGEPATVVVTLTDSPSEISGVVHARDGSPDAGATVIMFPTDNQSWTSAWRNPLRFRAVRTRRDGVYRYVGPPGGEYFVVAIPDRAAADWQDAAFLEGLARHAARVRIAAGDKRTQNLETVEVR